ATPDLATALAELAGQGALAVDVLPIFLGVGKHLREDLPALMAQLQQAHPGLQLRLRAAVGETPELIDALARLALKS
ncbi:MAG: CbiX/SirB N-terminal domain-containing protein, partial [Proteobacteria bacterium]|nr:CbiX/SirB N-terminal domain-containing protein [Pseudomonadota bacterium]